MFNLTPRAIVAASILALLGFIPTSVEAQAPATAPTPTYSNPWDKYDPALKAPAAKTSTATPSTGSNPWDKYDTSDIKASAPKKPQSSNSSGSNPRDKYVTDKVPMVPFAPNTPSNDEVQEGTNPWDKYTPAAMPKVTPKHRTAKEKEKAEAQPLELAPALPERKIPAAPNKVHNQLPMGKNYYYAIAYNDQLIGYSEFSISNEIVLDGRASYLLNSSSRVKVGTDAISDLRYYSKMQVSKRDLSPSSLICSQKSANNDYRITCIYSPGLVAQNNIISDKVNSYIHELKKDNANLVFNNLWGQLDTFAEHYWLLALSAVKGGQVEVYDPILRTDGKVTVYSPVPESWTSNNKTYSTMLYTVSDMYGSPLAHVRLNATTKELLEIKEIGSGITFRASNAGVVKQVDKATGVNLWPSKVRISNIYFSDPNKLTHLEANLEMSLRGGQLAQHSITGYEQKMYGTVKEGKISGRVVVDVKPTSVKQNMVFPFTEEVPADIAPYLEFNVRSEANDTAIYNKANEITWKSGTAYQAARRLTGFIANNIENGTSLPSALQTLEHGVGNPESKAMLLVAMSRSVGIPARCIGGLVYHRGEFAPHYWAELWLGPEAKWMAFDPSTNEAGSINASHISLWESGDVQDLNIEVEKFAPHPQRQVPFFTKKLKWPVGEKRSYAIVSEGKRIGTETAHLQDLQLVDNHESYNFHAETAMFDSPREMPNLAPKAKESEEAAPAPSEEAPSTENAAGETPNGEQTAQAPQPTAVDVSAPLQAEVQEKAPEAALTDKALKEAQPQEETAEEVSADVPAAPVSVEPPKIVALNACDNLYNSYGLPQSSIVKVGKDNPQETKLRFAKNRVYEETTVKGQTIEREVPVSNGLYLADQRFLSQWILAVEQIAMDEEQEDQDAGTYSIHVFIPELLSSQELLLTEDEEQVDITRPDGTSVTTTVLRAEKGMEFYVDDEGHVLKLAIPNRHLELYLEKREFSLE